jgi:TolB protein
LNAAAAQDHGKAPDKHQGEGAFIMPAWSPVGDKIAFVYDAKGNTEVFVVNADSTNPVNVSNSPAMDRMPVWRPDGKALAFMSNRNGSMDICTVDSDGQNLECVTAESKKTEGRRWDDRFPVWSPDGATIAYCSYRDGYPQVWFMDANGANPRLFVTGTKMKEEEKQEFTKADSCYPNYSANGRTMAFSSRGDIYTMDLKTGRTKNVTAPLIRGNMVDDTMPVWAPRGNRLAFIGRYEAFNTEIYTISSAGKQVRRVTDNLHEDFLPTWRPDGKGLIFSAYVRGRAPELFVANPMGPEEPAIRLTDNFDIEMYPAFSPDGEQIVFVRRLRGRDELYIMGKDGEVDGASARQFFADGFSPMVQTAGRR